MKLFDRRDLSNGECYLLFDQPGHVTVAIDRDARGKIPVQLINKSRIHVAKLEFFFNELCL